MKGEKLFQTVASRKPARAVIINPACGIGEMRLDATAVKLLANGSILEPLQQGKQESGLARIVEPANYPPKLIEPLLRYLRRNAGVKAAWLFCHQPESPKAEPTYIVGLLMADKANAGQVQQDLMVVAKGVRPVVKCSATILNLRDPSIPKTIAKREPFYAVPDFKQEQKLIVTGVAISNVIGRIIAFILFPVRLIRRSGRSHSEK
jgi:hypothetical protein